MKRTKGLHKSLLWRIAGLSLVATFLFAACSPGQVVIQTVVVVVTSTPSQSESNQTASDTPTTAPVDLSPTQPPEATATPQPSDTPLPAPTNTQAPLRPSPTPLILVSFPVEGDQSRIQATIVYPSYDPAATTDLVFQVKARNPQVGNYDGAGIDSVDFVISKDGQPVYNRTEKNAAYCAFAGGEPDCNVFNFAQNNNQWPGTNIPLESGTYTLDITIHSANGDSWGGEITFNIQLP
jgi:hypothetical protein